MKKFLSLVLALVMTMSLVTISAGAKDFTDADKVTYTEAVDVLSAVKVIDGYTDGAFKPTTQLNRGQAAKILCNMILGPTTASALKADAAPFKDVPVDNTFAAYIAYCAKEGIIDGYTDGTFRPTAPLTGYAFMKLLLGALGYDKDIEGYNQPNWSINVAKQALAIGLDKGLVEDFDGTKIVTREEACLYALNTLQANLVEYDSRTTVSVAGATVTIAGDSAKPMIWETGVKNDGNIGKADGFIQFAEQYFENLKLNKNASDAFARPANEWKLKAEKIDTYTKTPDLTYTKKVEVGDIYKDLGLSSKVAKANVSVYVDGVVDASQPAVDIKKGDEDNKYGANGVLTEVFYDDKADTVTITEVNTYIGTVVKSVAAKGNKDAYVVIATEAPNGAQQVKDGTRPTTDGTLEFTTDDKFDDDAYVLYTYSQADEEVKSLAVAEKVSGTVTRTENDKTDEDAQKSLVIDGNTYKAAKKVAGESIGNVTVKNDYVIYVDSYGYMIYVEEDEFLSGDYALVLNAADRGTFVGKKAELLFTDGTVKTVTTEKDYSTSGTTNLIGKIVTFKTDADGVYTLKAVSSKQANGAINSTVALAGLLADDKFDLKNDRAGITVGGNVVNANSATTFVVKDNTATEDEYTAYTGIKNAPTIKAQDMDSVDHSGSIEADEKVEVYYFCKNGKMVTVMFVMPGSALLVEDDSNKSVYLAVKSVSNLIHDNDGDYYEYDAIVNGELKTVKIADDVRIDGVAVANSAAAKTLNGLYKSYTVNKKGIITSLRNYNGPFDNTVASEELLEVSADGKKFATGIDKVSKEYTVILDTAAQVGGPYTITVDDNAKIYYVDKKGNISESSYKGIAVDENDLISAVVKDWLVKTLVIREVPAATVDYGMKVNTAPNATVKIGATTIAVGDVAKYDKGDMISFTVTADAGYKVKSVKIDGVVVTADANGVYTIAKASKEHVIDVETESTTKSFTLTTIHKNATTVDVDTDGTDDLTLAGSSAKASYEIDSFGRMFLTVDYTAPKWVPDGATVTLNVPVKYNNVSTIKVIGLSGVIADGKATLSAVEDTINYLTYDADKLSLGTVTLEDFTAVNIYYFDETGDPLESKLDMVATTKTVTAAGNTVTVKMPNTSAGNATCTYGGTFSWTGSTPVAWSTLKTGWTGGTVTTDKTGPAWIMIDTSNMVNTYSITGDDTLEATAFQTLAGINDTRDKALKLVITDVANIAPGSNKLVNIKMSGTVTENYNFVVTLNVNGQTISKPMNGTTDVGFSINGINDNIVLDASNVTVTAVPKLAVVAGSWTAGTLTLTFNRALENASNEAVTTGNYTITGATNGKVLTPVLSADGKTVTIATDASNASPADWAAGITVAPNTTNIKDDTYNANALSATTVTLVPGGKISLDGGTTTLPTA